jgi:hypothetical protein
MAIGDLARAAGLTVYEGTQDARYGYQNDNQRGDDIAKLGTDLRRTLREDYAQLSDGGERFMSRLQMGLDVRLGIAGDSLSTEMDEYPALLAEWIVSLYPNIRCLFSRWNGAGYDTETLNEGTPTAPRATRMLRDDFSKVVADVYGSTPDNMGGAWGRNGVNTSGDWSSAGAGAVASNETARGFLLWGTGSNGTQDIETRIVLPAGNPAATTAFRVYTRYANAANHTYLSIDVRAAGTYVVTWVTVRDGVATVRADLPAVAIPANRTLDIRLIVGPTVRFIVNAQSLTTTLNSLDIEATTGGSGSSVGFGTTGSGLAGLTVKYFEAGISRSLTYQYLYVYNAGRGYVPGRFSARPYDRVQLAQQLPGQPEPRTVRSRRLHREGRRARASRPGTPPGHRMDIRLSEPRAFPGRRGRDGRASAPTGRTSGMGAATELWLRRRLRGVHGP